MTEPVHRHDSTSERPAGQVSEQDEMLRLLVCPADHGQLRLEQQILVCTVCGRRYPIEDGVPNMLLSDDQT